MYGCVAKLFLYEFGNLELEISKIFWGKCQFQIDIFQIDIFKLTFFKFPN